MKNVRCVAMRRLLCAALLWLPVLVFPVSGAANAASDDAVLQLPRLTRASDKSGPRKIREEAFEVLPLKAAEHASPKVRHSIGYLEIEPMASWNRALRRKGAGASYVTLALTASTGTRIDVGGATVVVEQSQRHPGYAAIHANGVSVAGGHETPWLLYNGARMALLDLITVMVDRRSGTWAMWIQDSLVFAGLPLDSNARNTNEVRISAGKTGAWISGIVCSDENPLFEDSNDNTVPDDFERSVVGDLLKSEASNATVNLLRRAWFEERGARQPSSLKFAGLLPDNFPAACSPDGEPVHGMANGLKFGAPQQN